MDFVIFRVPCLFEYIETFLALAVECTKKLVINT